MAMVIPGVAGEFFGSVGMLTFSKVASGFNIVKKKAQPSGRQTKKRMAVRRYMSWAINRWITVLTDANKDDWDDAAANFVQTRHGVAYDISGHNLWCAVYVLHLLAEESPPSAPTIFAGRMGIVDVNPSWNAVTHKVQINWGAALPANEGLLIWNTNADRSNSTYRRINYRNFQYLPPATAAPVDLEAQYRGASGTLHLKWISMHRLGSMSSLATESYDYTWA